MSMLGLEKKGLIGEVPAPDAEADARRRYYTLRALGRRVLDLELARLARLVRHAGPAPGGSRGSA